MNKMDSISRFSWILLSIFFSLILYASLNGQDTGTNVPGCKRNSPDDGPRTFDIKGTQQVELFGALCDEDRNRCYVRIDKWYGIKHDWVHDGTCTEPEWNGDFTETDESEYECTGPCNPPPIDGDPSLNPTNPGSGGGEEPQNPGNPGNPDNPGIPCVETDETEVEDIFDECTDIFDVPVLDPLPDAVLDENSLNLVYDRTSISRWRWGYHPFSTGDNSDQPSDVEDIITYLKQTYTRVGIGCMEDANENPTRPRGQMFHVIQSAIAARVTNAV